MIELTWLGQAGFLVETASTRLLIDPWVSPVEGRLIDPPPLGLVTQEIDYVLVTHEHLDHLDIGFLRLLGERSPDAVLVIPEAIAHAAEGVLTMSPVQPGVRRHLPAVSIEVVGAWHAVTPEEPYSHGDGRFVGYIVTVGGCVLYHAGDTIATPDLLASLDGKSIGVALLPVNGRDFFREADGFVGNLDAREAVRLARRIGAHTVVPYHWDGFAGNTERPGRVVDEAAAVGGLHVLCLARLVPFRLDGSGQGLTSSIDESSSSVRRATSRTRKASR